MEVGYVKVLLSAVNVRVTSVVALRAATGVVLVRHADSG